ncbi:vesicle transport protein GOT1B isoform X1 [Heterocephalus glaber]|uniref:Vesicle transport protein GOT1B isoform X1 n=1 Tax=Heterocephalus glaber TaxID=10181 RepID=A0AAX6T4D4_HETGA|nr:vesicle transport protein GOT1B isoform X1 [Heterocephalus glaber]
MKATGFFLGGVFVVLIGWPLIGMIFEIYGFFLLFRGFFPMVVGFIRRVPVLGSLLNLPGIRSSVSQSRLLSAVKVSDPATVEVATILLHVPCDLRNWLCYTQQLISGQEES